MRLLIHSGLWVALIAVALLLATARALRVQLPLALSTLVGLGSFAVYNLDRLRDRRRDAGTHPAREDFVGRHQGALAVSSALAAAAAVLLGLRQGPGVIALLAGVAALSVLHRRLKHLPGVKPLYVAAAWLAVVVGLPLVVGRVSVSHAWGEIVPVGLALVANILACDAADDEAEAHRLGPAPAWWTARAVAAAGVAAAFLARPEVLPMAWIPFILLLALLRYDTSEHYTAMVIDGSLLAGAVLTLITLALRSPGLGPGPL